MTTQQQLYDLCVYMYGVRLPSLLILINPSTSFPFECSVTVLVEVFDEEMGADIRVQSHR